MIVIAASTSVSPAGAAAWLLGYSAATIRFYDHGGLSSPLLVTRRGVQVWASGPPALSGRIAMLNSVGTGDDVAALLDAASAMPPSDWTAVDPDTHITDTDAAPGGAAYLEAERLFRLLDDIHGVGVAVASKLLHLRLPALVPVLDSCVTDLYADAARGAGGYWAAMRSDLLVSGTAFDMLRSEISRQGGGSAHSHRLLRLTDLRLLDMLAWGASPCGRRSGRPLETQPMGSS